MTTYKAETCRTLDNERFWNTVVIFIIIGLSRHLITLFVDVFFIGIKVISNYFPNLHQPID